MTNFAFLAAEFPEIFESAKRAEGNTDLAIRALQPSMRGARWSLPCNGPTSTILGLHFPYDDRISALIHEPSFQKRAGQAIFTKAKLIIQIGNRAVHEAKDTSAKEAADAVRELFHLTFWLARTYGKLPPPDGLAFDAIQLSRKDDLVKKAFAELTRLKAEMEARDRAFAELLRDKGDLDAELKEARAERDRIRRENEQRPDHHDYSEDETRDLYIDLLLKEAGWKLDQPRDREFPVEGMPNNEGRGFVDYVLWGDDGKPLALVEAKRTKRDPRAGQQQAKLYADCLERKFGQRPVIFYTNGYDHWIWDDTAYAPREVSGFYKKDELQLLVQRRADEEANGLGCRKPENRGSLLPGAGDRTH